MNSYPVITAYLSRIRSNAALTCQYCEERGIDVAGVIKFSDGDVNIAKAYYEGGCKQISSSRIIQLKAVKEIYPELETMLIRIPMLSEIDEMVKCCDISLNSERSVLEAINASAERNGKVHDVVLMYDLCDRREGISDKDELTSLAVFVEKDLKFLNLRGIGTTFGCLSGAMPSYELLEKLVEEAHDIENNIGRKLEMVSGGSTITLSLLVRDGFPEGINHLRIGGFIANPINMHENYDTYIGAETEDCFKLDAELIEVREKDFPGSIGRNWSGQTVHFDAKPLHTRAIAAVGCQDIADCSNLIPLDPYVKVLASSSDHTVLDVTDCPTKYKPGDIISFSLRYEGLLFAFSSRHVRKKYET